MYHHSSGVAIDSITTRNRYISDDHTSSSRRFLQSITIDEESIYSYAEKGLISVTEPPNSKNEVSLFWHIPKVSILFFFYSL